MKAKREFMEEVTLTATYRPHLLVQKMEQLIAWVEEDKKERIIYYKWFFHAFPITIDGDHLPYPYRLKNKELIDYIRNEYEESSGEDLSSGNSHGLDVEVIEGSCTVISKPQNFIRLPLMGH